MSDEAPPPEDSVPGGPPPDEAIAADEASAADETDAGWAAPGTPARGPDVTPTADAPSAVPPPFPPPTSSTPSGSWTPQPAATGWTPPPTPPSAPPAATTTGWTAPSQAPPGPKRRKIWPWILGLVLLMTAGAGVVGGTVYVTKMLPVVVDVDAFMSDVQEGRSLAAYNHLCASDRQSFSSDGFRTTVLANNQFRNISSFSVNPFPDVNGDTATIDVTITYNDATAKTYSLDVVKEDGDWQVCSKLLG